MKRDPANPIITARDIPPFLPKLRDPSSVFNPGAIRYDGYDLLLLRVQTRGRETVLVPVALHDDGGMEFFAGIAEIHGIESHQEVIHHVYDPRLTEFDGTIYMVFACDVTTADGGAACRLGVARMRSPTQWELVGIDTSRDSRNGVLFPAKHEDQFIRLERPNHESLPHGPRSGATIHVATSNDLKTWRLSDPVLTGRPHYWDELIGSGPPPALTERGWLHVYHGVATHFAATNIYQAGVCLLAADDPGTVLRRGTMNVLEPREMYELVGQVPNVVFPSGMVVDDLHNEVRLYYGAADTCVGRARTTIDELLACCEE